MKKFESYGIIWRGDFKILPKSFFAITLFGVVYSNYNTDILKYILEHGSFGKKVANHESIHIMQANSFKTKYFAFYILYLYYWIVNLFKYGLKDKKAYYNIPFEREAFANEENYNYKDECNFVSKWKTYK